MATLPDKLRPFHLWFLLLAAAVAIIEAAYMLLPPWLHPLGWLISVLVTAVTTFLLREFFPENARDRIRTFSKRIQKRYWENPQIKISFAINYSLSDSVEFSELSNEIQSEFGAAPSGQTRFEINEDTDFGTIQKVLNLDIDRSGAGRPAVMQQELQQETQQVGNIRLELNADTRYNDLKNMLIDLFEQESDIRSTLAPYDIEPSGYEILCELEEPILLKDFMTKFNMDSVQTTNEEEIDIEFRENEIRLRNPNGGQLSSTFDKIVEIVTYYG